MLYGYRVAAHRPSFTSQKFPDKSHQAILPFPKTHTSWKKRKTSGRRWASPQLDMAVLLGISRSHYTMHESGQRKLPLSAMQLLASLLSYYQSKKKVRKLSADAVASVEEKRRLLFARLLKENEYQRRLVERKMKNIQEKIQLAQRRPALASLLEEAALKTGQYARTRTIIAKAIHKKEPDWSSEFLKLEIRHGILKYEKLLLDEKLGDLGRKKEPPVTVRKKTA